MFSHNILCFASFREKRLNAILDILEFIVLYISSNVRTANNHWELVAIACLISELIPKLRRVSSLVWKWEKCYFFKL